MINQQIKMGGEYKLVISKPDGMKIETEWFDNIILDQGLDKIGADANEIIARAQVGTGTSTPIATQIGLDSPIAVSNHFSSNTVTNSGSPSYITTHLFSFGFAQGAVVGNITEIGVGWGTTIGNTLFSRALILDNTGSPTAITITAIDQLTVYYRLKLVPPLADGSGSFVIGSTTYNYTSRVARVGTFSNSSSNFYNGSSYPTFLTPYYPFGQYGRTGGCVAYPSTSTLGAITGFPTGTGSAGSAYATTYTPGTFNKNSTFSWAISEGNVSGGIKAIEVYYSESGSTAFQYLFDTPIPKDNTKTLSITMNISWARA